MANNAVIGRKVAQKRGVGGGGGWKWGRGARAWRGSGSDDGSDEEYVVGVEEGEGGSSYDSYSSDASLEASQDAAGSEEEGYDSAEEEEIATARGRRPRKGSYVPPCRRTSLVHCIAEEEVEAPAIRKPRAAPRQRSVVLAEEEGDECDDDDDEDFAPEEDDDDEEELSMAPVRKAGGVKNRPAKRQRRKTRPRSSDAKDKRKNAPIRQKKRRRRVAPSSDDDDFVVKDRILVEVTNGTNNKKKRRISNGRKRTPWGSRSDSSESDSSDFDYKIPDEEAMDLRAGGPLGHRNRRPLLAGSNGEKGKGKDVDDMGKQVCGICLSMDRKGIIRGLLDCCTHYFCFACIVEWSKVESRCPLCKRRFETVSKSARSDAGFSLRTAIIRIPKRDQVYQPSEEEIRGYLDPYANVVCVECQQAGDDNLMLLCDICDSPAHTYCVGLGREVPEGNWYCDGCRCIDTGSSNSVVQVSMVEQGARGGLLQDNSHDEAHLERASTCIPCETPRLSATLPIQLSSEEIRLVTPNRHPSSLDHHVTASQVSGLSASTVSGRRSIHQHIRIMLSNNRIGLLPERVMRNNVICASNIANDVSGSEFHQDGQIFCSQQESLSNRIDRTFLGTSVTVCPRGHNEASSCHMVEAAEEAGQL